MKRKLFFLLIGLSWVSWLKAQAPVANFSASSTSGCAGFLVSFTDLSTNGPNTWSWSFGPGASPSTSPFQNPTIAFTSAGVYSVTLTASNASGSSLPVTKTGYITVFANPVANFSASPTTGCYPLPVQFTNNSTPGTAAIVTWNWDFGDGTIAGTTSPLHVYTSATPPAGVPVTLQVIDQNGCSSSLTKPAYIQIPDGINASFTTINNSVGCKLPIGVSFTNTTNGGAPNISYNWNFGDNSPPSTATNPQHNYNSTGSFTILLTASSPGAGGASAGCQDTVSETIQLSASNVQSSFTADTNVCIGTPIIFQNTSVPNPSSTLWNFGDGTTSTQYSFIKNYAAPGTYTVTLTNNFGPCQDAVSKTVVVNPFPVTNFTANDSTSCHPSLTVNFTDHSNNASSWQWNFGDGSPVSTSPNPVHGYNGYGQYTVTLITSNSTGCNDTLVKPSYINLTAPTINFLNLPFNGCTPLSFTPTYSVKAIDGVAGYAWNFGNGTQSTLPNPSTTYTAQGTYPVILTITTKTGCTVSDTGTVKAGNNKPTATFTVNPTSVCPFQTITISGQSTGTPVPDEWDWTMGDGNSVSNKQNFTWLYPDPGTYRITMSALANGCQDTLSQLVVVNPPQAIFTYTTNCNNKTQFTFINQSIQAITSSWNFNDGSPLVTTTNPVHNFPPGSAQYPVVLTTTNGNCTSTTQQIISVVNEKADFSLSSNVLCRNTPLIVKAINSNPLYISSYAWNFGDSASAFNTGAGDSASHTYTVAGKYLVTLTLTDVNGCKDSIQYPVQVNGPVAGFHANTTSGCKGLTVTMTDLTKTDGTHPIVHWHWNFGDGATLDTTAPPFIHTYTTQGIFSITLIATDASGCVDSITQYNLITVNIPVAQFSTIDSMSCPGSPVVFDNFSTGQGLSYNWSFGNGATSTNPGPSYTYNQVGFYTVKLNILDQFGCTDSMIKTAYIRIDTPNASFILNDSISTCPPMKGVFTFTGHYPLTTEWVFGDGATSPLASPVHVYNIPGKYTALLTVTSPGGCIARDSAHIQIFGPYGQLYASPDSGCNPLTVHFNIVTQGVVKYYWNFGDSTLNSNPENTSPTYTYTYTKTGTFKPSVYLQDSSGCQVPINGPDSTILVVGVNAKFGYDKQVLCNNGSIQFTDSTITNGIITSWLWDFGDGTQSTLPNPPAHYYGNTGYYTVKLTVTTQYGCTDTYTQPNLIKVVSSPVTDITGANSECIPGIQHFAGIVLKPDTSALNWAWNIYSGQILYGQKLLPLLYPVAGQDSVQLVVTNSSGCKDTVNKQFTLYPLPSLIASPDTTICLGQSLGLLVSGALHYNWLPPNTSLSCTNCNNPVANPALNTTYIVQGSNNFGCLANDTVQVHVIQPTTLSLDPLDSLCKGQSLQLSASGADLYTWTPATGLSDPFISNPVANPDTTTLYSVTGTDFKSCFSDTKTAQVTVFNYPTISLGPDTVTLPVGTSFPINGIGSPDIVSIIWAPVTNLSCSNCLAPVANPVNSTTYFVKVTNNGGCSTEDKITFIVTCNNQNFFVPNTFSPNDDGINDYFYVRGKGLNTVHSLQIFNRWGQKVFEKRDFPPNDQQYGWDGKINGQKAPMDVYVYLLEIICDNSTIIPYHGNVALIR